MRFNCCHVSLAFVLKFLNFLQAFIGVSILMYSIWMLNQWNHQEIPQPPFPHPPHIALHGSLGFDLNSINLPAPWFIYAFMGVGVLVCCVTFLGCIAAELINGCCLCFYTLLVTVILILEAVLVGFIAIDHRWEEHLPIDPTGQLDSLKSFIKENMDICEWVGIAVLVIQASSLLMALVLRASVSSRSDDSAYEDEYDARVPLVSPKSSQASGSSKFDNRANHSDIWSSRMREKYGLNNSEKISYQQP